MFTAGLDNADISAIRNALLHGADINDTPDSLFGINNGSSLSSAIRYLDDQTVLFLLENGADHRYRDWLGNTPLHVAISSGNHIRRLSTIREMVVLGADPNIKNIWVENSLDYYLNNSLDCGISPLLRAVYLDDLEAIKNFKHLDVNEIEQISGNTILHKATGLG